MGYSAAPGRLWLCVRLFLCVNLPSVSGVLCGLQDLGREVGLGAEVSSFLCLFRWNLHWKSVEFALEMGVNFHWKLVQFVLEIGCISSGKFGGGWRFAF